ncbi:Fc receptor-like protein 2 [Megalobrama amblycephala]|uniref:Fc receptor-like protein 2 n=1 Tax=Megalobrama amblycephala TaxID=75352 RepID=UPI00201455B0|nr:Fc receptor-like protein 2 [Megalobrama amblycephala]
MAHIVIIVNCCHYAETPKPKVTIKPDHHVFRGDSVTLRCDIDAEGVTSWRYSWYKEGSTRVISELQELTFRSVSESDAGKYFCNGTETEGSRHSSQLSDEVTLTVSDPRAVLSVSPQKWLTEGDPVTLICELNGSSTGWTFSWFTQTVSSRQLLHNAVSYSICKHCVSCVSVVGVILESPVHPVTEGDNLTLRCLYPYTSPSILSADFYKDGSLIQNQTTEMIIPTVSKSHEGFYYCKHPERGESPKSWISVRGSHSDSQISVLNILSSVLAACPYLLVTVVLIYKCCRMRDKTPQ